MIERFLLPEADSIHSLIALFLLVCILAGQAGLFKHLPSKPFYVMPRSQEPKEKRHPFTCVNKNKASKILMIVATLSTEEASFDDSTEFCPPPPQKVVVGNYFGPFLLCNLLVKISMGVGQDIQPHSGTRSQEIFQIIIATEFYTQ